MIAGMSETPERPTETTGPISAQSVAPPPPAEPPPPLPPSTPPQPDRPNRLNQVAAWVGIVAGVVFIVAVVFGTGFMVGKHSGGGPRFDRAHDAVVFKHRGPFPMGPMGEFERGPFVIPRGPDFQPPQPPQAPGAPTTTAPARP
jgi:hypothetical protein